MSKQINDKKARDWEDYNQDEYYKKPNINYKDEDSYDTLPLKERKGFKSKKKYPKYSWCKRYLLSKLGQSKDLIYSDLKQRFTNNDEFNYPSYVLEFVRADVYKEENKIVYIRNQLGKTYTIELSNNCFYWNSENILCIYKKQNIPENYNNFHNIYKFIDGLYCLKWNGIWYQLNKSKNSYLYPSKNLYYNRIIKEQRLNNLNKNNRFGIQIHFNHYYLIDYFPNSWCTIPKKILKKYNLQNG